MPFLPPSLRPLDPFVNALHGGRPARFIDACARNLAGVTDEAHRHRVNPTNLGRLQVRLDELRSSIDVVVVEKAGGESQSRAEREDHVCTLCEVARKRGASRTKLSTEQRMIVGNEVTIPVGNDEGHLK